MEKREPEAKSREDYKHLPPRITQDEMIPVQPLVQAVDDPTNGDEEQWHIRRGWAG